MSKKSDKKDLLKTISELKKRIAVLEKPDKDDSKGTFRNGMKVELLAQMSHELRTPVNILLNSVDMLKEDHFQKPDPYTLEILKVINSSGKRIRRTIDLLVHIIELQSGTYSTSLTFFDIYQDIRTTLYKDLKSQTIEKDIEFIWRKEGEKHLLETDAYAVTEIFTQLIENAIKFTNFGKVEVIVQNGGENHTLTVKDTGIGISEEFLPLLFEPFHQEDRGYSRKYEGTGLGLSIVKQFCDLIQAKVTVKSRKGNGSIFTVVFKDLSKS